MIHHKKYDTINYFNYIVFSQDNTIMTTSLYYFPYLEHIRPVKDIYTLIEMLPSNYQLLLKDNPDNKNVEWKTVFTQAFENREEEVLILLARNKAVLPYSAWLDVNYVIEKKNEALKENIFEDTKYIRWCVACPEMVEQFDAKQRGHFVHLGLIMYDNILLERAIGISAGIGLDLEQWDRKIPVGALFIHMERNVNDLEFLTEEYIDWYYQNLLVKRPIDEQYQLLLGWFSMSANAMKKYAVEKAINQIIDDNPLEKETDYEVFAKVVKKIKHYLKWNEMPNPVQGAIFYNMELAQKNVNDFSFFNLKRKIETTMNEIQSFIRYLKLDQQLPEKEDQSKSSFKI
jgi:hypothetical protein